MDPALIGVALGLSAKNGDGARFQRFRDRFEQASTPTERDFYLGALGGFRKADVVDSALQYVLTGSLRPQEYLSYLFNLQGDEVKTRDTVFRWVMAHYQDLVNLIPSPQVIYFPWFANGASAERMKIARRFFAIPAHAPIGTLEELDKVAEEVMRRINLNQREGSNVAAYLQRIAH